MIQRLQVKRNEKGFTLIELLIVIIVLGILAAIVVFAVGSTRRDAVASSCKTAYKSVELSAEGVSTKMGGYPATADSATSLVSDARLGGLLKTYPADGDFTLKYAATGAAVKTVDGKTYHPGFTINVWTTAATPVDLGPAISDCADL